VVRSATPIEDGLDIVGAMPAAHTSPELSLVLKSGSDVVVVPVRRTSTTWSASLSAATLRAGRWTVSVRAADIAEMFPVVTARMALPPVAQRFLIQPLADRKNGWRFLVDRRTPPKKGLAAALARLRGGNR
jgi:voltage-gated potassium channel Kch